MTKKPFDLDVHNKQLNQHHQRTKQAAETYRNKSKELEHHLESSTRSREEALAKEIAELKQATMRNAQRDK
ncbi:hypothetical protein EVJ27_08145 [Exiguobacterium sp. SH3S2]|uniref:hypothetical protein n=1 Tax=Exiguobacterium TaxID=33986 RepID=UPI0008779831|nr:MULTISPECIES: hypothetical protein [Exiguobacterium]OGX79500.1 hypothetical protein A6395_06395 [Exiguobacterium sp. SH31]TCI26078.1 hypothetical protein EVJ32_07505 [Exiguobacterium sp. SH5S4]TCI36364.1 hypothetical protein EVJ29_07725 [Exiguobacterium sp. SH4S7]TCI44800.1 hypothetical protein EVJ28_08145 [Exiguobacterium sp. SH3S3]TCI48412.1 hypothetical protein EVJ31_05120 [Exiguobacterium sp. SH5S32]